MSVAQRLRLTIELIEFAERALEALPLAERERRLKIVHDGNRASNDEIVRRLAAR